MDDNEKTPKNAKKLYCNFCDFMCFKQSEWERHISRPKHLKNINDKNDKNNNIKTPKNATLKYICECGKSYSYQSGLVRHKKTHSFVNEVNNNVVSKKNDSEISDVKTLTNLVLEVVKQNQELVSYNQELTNKLVEICGNVTNNTHINNNSHNNNKTFNLNMFLNETCKDAMNINDFVDSLQLQLSDLEEVGKLGFVEGISNIIVKNLKAMDIHKRPVHCADQKREVLYIKDEDKWERENEQKQKLRKAIKRVAFKNEKLLPKYKEEHPGCNYSDSKFSDQYSKLVIEAMGGTGNNETEKEDKIIRKIAKEVIIDKTNSWMVMDHHQ